MTDSTRDEQALSPGEEFGLSAVRELLRLISETDVTEIQIERGSTRLHIKRGAASQPQQSFFVTPSLAQTLPQPAVNPLPPQMPHPYPAVAAPIAAAETPESDLPPGAQTITAPMVGTFYTSPSPKDPPFVKEGDTVHAGETIGIIEAMKIMNEIESEHTGKVVRVLVHTGQPVEYGQPLMVIVPE